MFDREQLQGRHRPRTKGAAHHLVAVLARILRHCYREALFLSVVWEKLPDPDDFLAHLQRKAGIALRTWPNGMEAWRFTVEKLSRRAGRRPTPSHAA